MLSRKWDQKLSHLCFFGECDPCGEHDSSTGVWPTGSVSRVTCLAARPAGERFHSKCRLDMGAESVVFLVCHSIQGQQEPQDSTGSAVCAGPPDE